MSRRKNLSAQDRDALLALVPDGAKRIQVQTEKGDLKYKDISDLADSDFIVTTKDGKPVVMMAKPGRKPVPVVAPANPLVGELIKRKKEAIEADPILGVARQNPDSPDVLHHVIVELGTEVASLGFERSEAERDGKDTTNVSVKRIGGLKALADTWLKRKDQMVSREIDIRSPGFQVAARFILDTIKEMMATSGIRPEVIQQVYSKAGLQMNDEKWENELKTKMKNS